MLVSPTQNAGVGGIAQRQPRDAIYFASQWNIGFSIRKLRIRSFLYVIHCLFAKMVTFFLVFIEKKTSTIGNLVVVGLHELRPLFDTCEQFMIWVIYGTCFSGSNDHKSLWNSTKITAL